MGLLNRVGGMAARLLVVGVVGTCWAENSPRLDYVYPAGGRLDSEFEIEVGGELSALAIASVSGEGVRATLLGAAKEIVYTRKGKAVLKPAPNRFRFRMTIAKDAQPGVRTFRVGTAYLLSEPLCFEVADSEETVEAFTNRATVSDVDWDRLPVTLNGRVHRNDADRYVFHAPKGSRVVAFTKASMLPRGMFRPILSFEGPDGKPCENVAWFDTATAPVAVLDVPAEGVYALKVTGASGEGGDDAVYRIRLGELPLVTGFSPLGAKAGESLNVALSGYNLPQQRVRLFTGGKDAEHCLSALVGDACVLPELRFDLSDETSVEETEPNDAPDAAETIEWPCVINGDLETAGGRDVYRFSAKAGEPLYLDARAEALGSPLEARLVVRDGGGAVAASGCFETNDTVLATVCGRDPSVCLMPKEDGLYTVEIADRRGRSGAEFSYRLRIGPPRPDYRLWMTPATLNIPADGSTLVTLYVDRIHGFDGEIRVGLDFPPLSVSSEGGLLTTGATMAQMTVSTDGVRYPRNVFGLPLTGRAVVEGREVQRLAVPVDFRMDAHGRLTRTTFADLSAKVGVGTPSLRFDQLVKTGPVDVRNPAPTVFRQPVPFGTKEPVRLTVLSAALARLLGGHYQPVVVWPEKGFVVADVRPATKQERAEVAVKADPRVMKPGQSGFFILGCCVRGDTNGTVTTVTQSVPYVIR